MEFGTLNEREVHISEYVGLGRVHGALVAVPEQQAALRRMRKLRDGGASLRTIAEKVTAGGVPISHVGVKKALLAAAERTAT